MSLRSWWRTLADDEGIEVGVVPHPIAWSPPPVVEPEPVDFGTVGEFLALCREVKPDLAGRRISWYETNGFFNFTNTVEVLRRANSPEPGWVCRVLVSHGANVSGGWDRVPGHYKVGAEGRMSEEFLLAKIANPGDWYGGRRSA